MLTKIPKAQVTIMSGVTWGMYVLYSRLQERSFLPDFPVTAKSFKRAEETIGKPFNQNTHKN
jgi:hypothetical protein